MSLELDCTPEELQEMEAVLARISDTIGNCEVALDKTLHPPPPADGWQQRAMEAADDLQRAFGD